MEQGLLWHHFAGMRRKGLLSSTRDGQHIYYTLKMREVIGIIQCLNACTFL